MTLKKFYYKWLKEISWKTQKRFVGKSKFYNSNDDKSKRNSKVNDLIFNLIKSGKPFMLARFGGVELRAALNAYHFYNRSNIFNDSFQFLINEKTVFWEFQDKNKSMINLNAGFFPNDLENVKKFQEKLFEDTKQLDILGTSVGLEHQVPTIPANVVYTWIRNLEPWWFEKPWTLALEGKKVLIIYPNEELVANQYKDNRTRIYKESKYNLPKFKLLTYEPIQTIAGLTSNFENWFDALDYMIEDIKKIDFDVAIIGAGAYGFSLASEIKIMGKQAIQLGGVTQLLFGIRGKRWEEWEHYTSLRKDGWVNVNRKPLGFEKIEGGCYW